MKLRTALAALATALIAGSVVYWIKFRNADDDGPFTASLECGPVVPVAEYRLSGPHTHGNLTVFLIHGRETLDAKSFLTLAEALDQKKAVVHETGTVSQLAIENLSPGEELYVQSGDIVKGGKQDRTFPYDTTISAKAGKVPVDSFCVEQGRWTKRGDESSDKFSSANNYSVSDFKRVSKSARNSAQGEVWNSVASVQSRLEKKLGTPVKDGKSESSLQLTLENPALQTAISPPRSALAGILAAHTDVIGVAVAVNGRMLSADVYASPALFRKLWPKLLESGAIESFLESGSGTPPLVTEAQAREFLLAAEAAPPQGESVTERTFLLIRKSPETILFDSCDRTRNNLVLHRMILAEKK